MMRRVVLAGVIAVVVLATSCVPQESQPFTVRTKVELPAACPPGGGPAVPPTTIVANNRGSRLIAPAGYRPGVKYPLVITLHGFVVGAQLWEMVTQMGQTAADHGYWALVPQGSDPGPRWAIPGGLQYPTDDIGWIDALVQQTAATVCVNRHRIFAVGHSAGGAMAVGLSCELPWRFRAIMSVSGANLTTPCPDAAPTDALIMHGTADTFAPPTGQTLPFLPPVGLTLAQAIASFATRNRCALGPVATAVTPTVTRTTYSCGGHRLEFWSIAGGGHSWSGSALSFDAITGPTDYSISATKVALDFFDAS